jgi:hypothetical protein
MENTMTTSNSFFGEKLFDVGGGKLLDGIHYSIHQNGIMGKEEQMLWSDVEQIFIGGTTYSVNGIPGGETNVITLVDSQKNGITFGTSSFFRINHTKRDQFSSIYELIINNISERQRAKLVKLINSGAHVTFGYFEISEDGFYLARERLSWKGPVNYTEKIENSKIKGCSIIQGVFYIQYSKANNKIKNERMGDIQYIPNIHLARTYIHDLASPKT